MKNIFILLIVGLLMVSCGDVNNPDVCLQNVKDSFPNCIIYKDNEKSFTFYVNDTVYKRMFIVKTLNFTDAQISEVVVLKEIK